MFTKDFFLPGRRLLPLDQRPGLRGRPEQGPPSESVAGHAAQPLHAEPEHQEELLEGGATRQLEESLVGREDHRGEHLGDRSRGGVDGGGDQRDRLQRDLQGTRT